MTDNELLLAMSDLLDTKLKAELQPIRDDIHVLKGEMQEVKSDIRLLKKDVQTLKGEMQEVKSDIRLLKKDVQTLKGDVQTLKTEMHVMKTEMQTMKTDLYQVKLYQENILEPRLNTIEACYTSTYDRYKRDVERMEEAFVDIEILKKTVADHSEKLQRLA